MTMTGLEAFDSTIHKTNEWLKDILYQLNWEDRQKAYLALRSTPQALRDRLTPVEAAELGAQLPMLIRGMFYEGWKPKGKPQKIRSKQEFLDRIRESFPNEPGIDVEKIARVVFKQLALRISKGEMQDIEAILPKSLKELWPSKYIAEN
ncbi:MAG: DUF2267 domain-containing protein [Proteobacteria bacterium]|nr:DUF2267 domain-containing protein [Pseudomonadota bacterium]